MKQNRFPHVVSTSEVIQVQQTETGLIIPRLPSLNPTHQPKQEFPKCCRETGTWMPASTPEAKAQQGPELASATAYENRIAFLRAWLAGKVTAQEAGREAMCAGRFALTCWCMHRVRCSYSPCKEE